MSAVKGILSILITLGILLIIGGIALAVFNSSRGRKTRPGVFVAVAGLIIVLVGAPLNAGLVLVQPNEVGVVFRQTASGDAALLEPLQPGLSWVVPFIDQVIIYDIGRQSVTMSGDGGESEGRGAVRAISNDGQVINVDITIVYRIDPARVNEVHRNWRSGFLDGFIVPQARTAVRNAISNYGAEQIYSGGRVTLESDIANDLMASLSAEGFQLVDTLIRNIEFSPQFADAIEQKQIAEQEAQQAERRVRQAEQEAEQARVQAQGRADAAVIAAQGEADSILIRAQAEAEALELINAVLAQNPNLIQWQYINELGDQVELIIIPSNSPFLFDIQQLLEQAGATQVQPSAPSGEGEGGG
ncbi:MAG: hypothetical protein Kow00124_12270 [Anaerolineae bacterium]